MNKRNLLLVASIFFFIASVKLTFFAFSWLSEMTENQIIFGIFIALPIGVLKYIFAFQKMSKKNFERIKSGASKQDWYKAFNLSTYILVLGMIAFGLSLRLIFKVPKHILMPVYFGIGIALAGAGIYHLVKYINFKIEN